MENIIAQILAEMKEIKKELQEINNHLKPKDLHIKFNAPLGEQQNSNLLCEIRKELERIEN